MFENMLDHPRIRILLKADFRDVQRDIPHRKLIYSGPVDEYFDYRYGALPYRSLRFKHETVHREVFQPEAVVNYPNEHAYTRVTEFKYLTGQQHPKTSIVYEYPQAEGDPYYPIPRAENEATYKRYKALAEQTEDVEFVGRLATYKYYNMDQVTAQALALFKRLRSDKANPTEKRRAFLPVTLDHAGLRPSKDGTASVLPEDSGDAHSQAA
jgi:UDP-galactopyranose mutase